MIEGIALVLVGSLVMFARPAHDLVVHRRQPLAAHLQPMLVEAFPIAAADSDLAGLVGQAEAALASLGARRR